MSDVSFNFRVIFATQDSNDECVGCNTLFVFFVLFIDPKNIGQRHGGIASVRAQLSKF